MTHRIMLKMVHVEQKDVTISKRHNLNKSYTRNPYNPKKDPTKSRQTSWYISVLNYWWDPRHGGRLRVHTEHQNKVIYRPEIPPITPIKLVQENAGRFGFLRVVNHLPHVVGR